MPVWTPEHHTNQYLSFRSHHPTAHKFAVVRTLMTRSDYLCSLGVEWTEEENRVTDPLRGNGYPSGFMQKHTITSRRREEVEVERPKTTLCIVMLVYLYTYSIPICILLFKLWYSYIPSSLSCQHMSPHLINTVWAFCVATDEGGCIQPLKSLNCCEIVG